MDFSSQTPFVRNPILRLDTALFYVLALDFCTFDSVLVVFAYLVGHLVPQKLQLKISVSCPVPPLKTKTERLFTEVMRGDQ